MSAQLNFCDEKKMKNALPRKRSWWERGDSGVILGFNLNWIENELKAEY